MRFASVTLQNFRNLPLVSAAPAGRRTFLLGANARGKTNFPEALGYVTALRSFRGAEPRALIASGLAQAAYFRKKSGIEPVLLCDDVLGELDPVRRARFWAALDPAAAGQVIATGTTLPDSTEGWQVFQVEGGQMGGAAHRPSAV